MGCNHIVEIVRKSCGGYHKRMNSANQAAATNPAISAAAITRDEWIWLAVILLTGVLSRVTFLSNVAVEHFDEGVYASNLWFDEAAGYAYPARHLYGPPLLPTAIEWALLIGGQLGVSPGGWLPLLPALLCGIATIPSVWWIGRKWFGPTAGLMSAALLASSAFHAEYSRAAMTDVPLVFVFVWAIYFGEQLLRERTVRAALLTGGLTGVAWWIKYNGWLPLAIVTATFIVRFIVEPASRKAAVKTCQMLLLAIGIAGLVWSPVLWDLQSHGGYLAVAANHSGYVTGWANWFRSGNLQLRNLAAYDRFPTGMGLIFAGWLLIRTIRLRTTAFVVAAGLLILLIGDFAGPILIVFCVGLCGVFPVIQAWRKQEPLPLPLLLSLVWFGSLVILTPIYNPFPRLALPGLTGALLLVPAVGLHFLRADRVQSPFSVRMIDGVMGLMLLFAAIPAGQLPRNGVALISRQFAERIGTKGDPAVVYVIAEPAVFFHLKANGLLLVGPVQNFGFLQGPRNVPIYLVLGPHAARMPDLQREWESVKDQFDEVATESRTLSFLVELDDHPGEAAHDSTKTERLKPRTFTLYRLR